MSISESVRPCIPLVLSVFAAVTAVHAQTPTLDAHVVVQKAEITLPDMACRIAPAELWLVVNDVDGQAYPATRQPNAAVWIASPTLRFDAAHAHASVRFDNTRTDCQKPDWKRDIQNPDAWVATFAFSCPGRAVREVAILAPSVFVSYVRELASQVPCRERGVFFGDGPHSVFAVRFSQEKLRLQIGAKQPDVNSPGLLVDDRAVIDDAKNGGHVVLDRARVVNALCNQRLEGRGSVPPTCSPNAREIDDARLGAAGLTVVELTVVK